MSRNLAGRAAALANGNGSGGGQLAADGDGREVPIGGVAAAAAAEPPDPTEDPDWTGPDQVPVHVAWSRLMGDIKAIRKNRLYNAAGTRFNFRGVDDTVNEFAPLVRKHGIGVWPVGVRPTYRDTTTKNNNKMHECTVVVQWMVTGPMGDELPRLLESAGEALDSMDKATAKAQSVAFRVLLLTAAMVPTGDPDPDGATGIERGEAAVRPPSSYAAEVLDRRTSRQRMMQIRHELAQHRMTEALATNEGGQQEQLLRMLERVDRQRYEEWQRSQQQSPAASASPPQPVDDGVAEPPPDVAARLAAEQAVLFASGGPPAS